MRRMLRDLSYQLGDLSPFILAARIVQGGNVAQRLFCFLALENVSIDFSSFEAVSERLHSGVPMSQLYLR